MRGHGFRELLLDKGEALAKTYRFSRNGLFVRVSQKGDGDVAPGEPAIDTKDEDVVIFRRECGAKEANHVS